MTADGCGTTDDNFVKFITHEGDSFNQKDLLNKQIINLRKISFFVQTPYSFYIIYHLLLILIG